MMVVLQEVESFRVPKEHRDKHYIQMVMEQHEEIQVEKEMYQLALVVFLHSNLVEKHSQTQPWELSQVILREEQSLKQEKPHPLLVELRL
jgi:hypothetical protein